MRPPQRTLSHTHNNIFLLKMCSQCARKEHVILYPHSYVFLFFDNSKYFNNFWWVFLEVARSTRTLSQTAYLRNVSTICTINVRTFIPCITITFWVRTINLNVSNIPTKDIVAFSFLLYTILEKSVYCHHRNNVIQHYLFVFLNQRIHYFS